MKTIKSVEEAQKFIDELTKKLEECTQMCVESGLASFGANFQFLACLLHSGSEAMKEGAIALEKVASHHVGPPKNITLQ